MNLKDITSQQLHDWILGSRDNFRIIDVRELREVAAGTIAGAEPMPLGTLPLRLGELHPDETLVLACRSGARSAQACLWLAGQGYENTYNLRGGLLDWIAQGLDTTLPATA